jgi:hypothetical protein
VLRDPGLAEEERAARLAAMEAELPESAREARAAATAALTLRRDETRLRAEGASDAEIGALREARFGPEAAARLAALDQARAAWSARVSAYRAERERVRRPDDPGRRRHRRPRPASLAWSDWPEALSAWRRRQRPLRPALPRIADRRLTRCAGRPSVGRLEDGL